MAYLDSVTRLGPGGGPRPQYVGFAAQASAALTADLAESTIVAGGQTIVITLTEDTWVAAGATFNAQRQNILDGITGATFISAQDVTTVVRTSDTVVTITLTAVAGYSIDSDEVGAVIVPATALSGGNALNAGTFTVSDDVQPVDSQFSGGYGALNAYNAWRQRKRRRDEERKRLLEQLEDIEDELDREIAELIHSDDEPEVEELREIVVNAFSDADAELVRDYSERVSKAFIRAATQQNYSALMAFHREMDRAMEEEEFLLMSVLLH